jgi:hypothetical protein
VKRYMGLHIVNDRVCGDVYETKEYDKGVLEISWECDGCRTEPMIGEVREGLIIERRRETC